MPLTWTIGSSHRACIFVCCGALFLSSTMAYAAWYCVCGIAGDLRQPPHMHTSFTLLIQIAILHTLLRTRMQTHNTRRHDVKNIVTLKTLYGTHRTICSLPWCVKPCLAPPVRTLLIGVPRRTTVDHATTPPQNKCAHRWVGLCVSESVSCVCR